MAATLLEIKSKMLLPKSSKEDEVQEEDPREDLMKSYLNIKLIRIYRQYLSKNLWRRKALCKDSSLADEIIDSFALPDRLSIEILMDKFKELMNKKQSHKDLENNRIYRDNITVEDKWWRY